MIDTKGVITVIVCFSAVAGWAVIESLLWLLSFVSISFGG